LRVVRRIVLPAPLLIVALLAAGCGGSSTSTTVVVHEPPAKTVTVAEHPTAKTRTSAIGVATPEVVKKTVPVVHLSTFKSPSGNIGCIVASGLARCDLRKKDWATLRPSDCPKEVDFGQGIQVGTSGHGQPVCAGDTTLDPTAPVLPYGTATVTQGFRCLSTAAGISCRNQDTGHGFTVSRQTYTVS
jgi:hypothetical protein